MADFFAYIWGSLKNEQKNMTAIVGVLNKHAVAIAADSAVTMGNTHKVVNSANKIFTLSKYHPVAVMTYSSASFMGVPWDIIVKEYRKQLKNKCFVKLEYYVDDFMKYLHKEHFFCDKKTQETYLRWMLESFFDICRNEICNENHIDKKALNDTLIEQKLTNCIGIYKAADKCPDFDSYSLVNFKKYTETSIQNFANEKGFANVDLLSESFFYYLSVKTLTYSYTGLVFVGYGEKEIYPSLIPVNISSLVVDGHLKYFIDQTNVAKISEHGSWAVISPFAQVDVVQTIIRGINPSFQDIIYNVIGKSIESYTDAITGILDKDPSTISVSTAIKGLDKQSVIKGITTQINKEMFSLYSKPLIDTVAHLDKEDMANMAESFISLTSLVRRMQPGEETVGGPVDVAVISKGDGFVWINRKHYFNPELNASFFSNYFK